MRPRYPPLAIDFGRARHSPGLMLGRALLLSAMAAGAWVSWQYVGLYQAQRQSQAAWSSLQVSGPLRAVSAEAQIRFKDKLRRAAHVIDRIDTPWDSLFSTVENTFDDRVALLTVEPDTERKELRLTAEAKDFSAMLDYLKLVRGSPVLKDAYLVSHQANLQDPQRPVRFAIMAPWNIPSPAVSVTAVPSGGQP